MPVIPVFGAQLRGGGRGCLETEEKDLRKLADQVYYRGCFKTNTQGAVIQQGLLQGSAYHTSQGLLSTHVRAHAYQTHKRR